MVFERTNHVELLRGLKGVAQAHDEWVFHFLEDTMSEHARRIRAFGLGVLNLEKSDDLRLAESFEGKKLVGSLVLDQHHLAEPALTQQPQHSEVVRVNLL